MGTPRRNFLFAVAAVAAAAAAAYGVSRISGLQIYDEDQMRDTIRLMAEDIVSGFEKASPVLSSHPYFIQSYGLAAGLAKQGGLLNGDEYGIDIAPNALNAGIAQYLRRLPQRLQDARCNAESIGFSQQQAESIHKFVDDRIVGDFAEYIKRAAEIVESWPSELSREDLSIIVRKVQYEMEIDFRRNAREAYVARERGEAPPETTWEKSPSCPSP